MKSGDKHDDGRHVFFACFLFLFFFLSFFFRLVSRARVRTIFLFWCFWIILLFTHLGFFLFLTQKTNFVGFVILNSFGPLLLIKNKRKNIFQSFFLFKFNLKVKIKKNYVPCIYLLDLHFLSVKRESGAPRKLQNLKKIILLP